MYRPILLSVAIVLIAFASWLTFFDHNRYGTHGDNFKCGEVSDTTIYHTATTYYLFSQPLNGQTPALGTCPYDMYKARTYALDLWIPAIVLGYISQIGTKSSQKIDIDLN